MHVLLVPCIFRQGLAQKRRYVLVGYNVLYSGNNNPSSSLENVFVTPVRMLLLDSFSHNIVPAKKQNADGEQSRVLVGSRISQHCKNNSETPYLSSDTALTE